MPKRYISVSGFAKHEQMEVFNHAVNGKYQDVAILAGIQASVKSQFDKFPTKHGPDWLPVGNNIWQVLSPTAHECAKRIIHYSYPEASELAIELYNIEFLARKPPKIQIDGWQFNGLSWHEKSYQKVVSEVRDRTTGGFLIAQLSSRVLTSGSLERIADNVGTSGVSHLLLDTSGGRGQAFDPEYYSDLVGYLQERIPEIGIGIAGGLGEGVRIENFRRLCERYRSLSCDAEGKLRKYPEIDGENVLSASVLCIEKARSFVNDAYNAGAFANDVI